MLDTPQLMDASEQLTAVVHLCVPRGEIENAIDAAIAEVMTTMIAQGAEPAGPCFSYHPRLPTDSFDFEVGFPLNRAIAPAGRVKISALPAARIARTVYRGGYEGLGAAWSEFRAWIRGQGLSPQDRLWECYLSGPESGSDSDKWQTELNCPLT